MDWFALVCVVAFHDQKAVFHNQLNVGIDPGSLIAGVLPNLLHRPVEIAARSGHFKH